MVSLFQLKKVRELSEQGYYGDDETQQVTLKETHGAIGGPTFMKNPESHKIVKVDPAGNVTPYKPTADKKTFKPPFGPIKM
jgi:hypothetical protein